MHSIAQANPSVQSGLDRLALWLGAEGYGTPAIDRILEWVATEETLAGCPDLNPADEEHAEHAYVEGCEPVPGVSAEWDEHASDPGRGPVYGPAGADGVLARLDWSLERMQAALADTEVMPAPISGGAPSQSFSEWLDANGGIAWEEGRDQ